MRITSRRVIFSNATSLIDVIGMPAGAVICHICFPERLDLSNNLSIFDDEAGCPETALKSLGGSKGGGGRNGIVCS